MNHEVKKEETFADLTPRITVENILEKVPVDELLGSVTTYPEGNDKNQSLRSSARVFKKIKLDANLNSGLPSTSLDELVLDKKEELKIEHTLQKDQKKIKHSWSVEERTLFFEALNEYGKDFENIHSYMVQKLKKKGVPDNPPFNKEQVRHLYYKTWHKISKCLKFAKGTKKVVQELYGLINYGELRKKIGAYPQKINHKLNELMSNGSVAVRVKGKMVRVKTPMCTALRQLNKLDDKDEDLKLPSRVVVELRPRDMSSFLRVQNMALNPRIRTVLPLQKKLSTLITCILKKWKSAEFEHLKNAFPIEEMTNGENHVIKPDLYEPLVTSQLKFSPPRGAKVTIPSVNISEYYTCESVCLKAFEERMGIESSKYVLSLMAEKKDNKRLSIKTRIDSLNENILKSPSKSETLETEKQRLNSSLEVEELPTAITTETAGNIDSKIVQNDSITTESSSVEETGDKLIDEALNSFFSSISKDNGDTNKSSGILKEHVTLVAPKSTKLKKENECLDITCIQGSSKMEENIDNNKNNKHISDEEQLSKLNKIQNGWTVEDCDTLTIGELYLMFGTSSKVVLEYYWTEKELGQPLQDNIESSESKRSEKHSLEEKFCLTEALKKLVSVVKLQQKKPTPKCPCGHVCSPKNLATKKSHNKSISENEERNHSDEALMEVDVSHPVINTEDSKQKSLQFDDFLRPQSKPPPVHLMAQLDSIQKLKPKYSIRKGRRLRTKQVVVERELPLMPKASSAHQIVRMNIIPQNNSKNQVKPNKEEVDSSTTDSERGSFAEQSIYIQESDIQNQIIIEENDDDILTPDLGIPIVISSTIRSDSDTTDTLSVFLQDSSRSLSPSGILKETANNWISSEVGDFSLSSFLGRLESPTKSQDDTSQDVDAQVSSLITENSFDYTAKFADLANKVASDS